jgi:diaminopimelate decarboxylase
LQVQEPAVALAAALRPLPPGVEVDERGHLVDGGCDVTLLARHYGTPLYVFNESVLRGNCRAYRRAFASYGPGVVVAYAAKALLTRAVAAVVAAEGLALDVVSGGELHVALSAGFPASRVVFHGNNKTPAEIEQALDAGVGRFVVDNFDELERLGAAAARRGRSQPVLLRVAPGIEAHTHEYIQTGSQDSKFGFDLASGQALGAARRCSGHPGLQLVGLHAHIGSQLLDAQAVPPLVERMLDLAQAVAAAGAGPVRELNLGGGAGIRYVDEEPLSPQVLAEAMTAAVRAGCRRRGMEPPALAVEPGRSVVGEAGIVLYTVGSRKRVPGLVPYVAVDGGMGDNIRPALYGAAYTVVAAARMHDPCTEQVHVVGRYCESGDFLARDVHLPPLQVGDLLAFYSAGAYQLPMASNYNHVPRPGALLVADGVAEVMLERETYGDLLARDRLPARLRPAAADGH